MLLRIAVMSFSFAYFMLGGVFIVGHCMLGVGLLLTFILCYVCQIFYYISRTLFNASLTSLSLLFNRFVSVLYRSISVVVCAFVFCKVVLFELCNVVTV